MSFYSDSGCSGSSAVKLLDYWLEGHKFKSQLYHVATVGPLNKALISQLLSCVKETYVSWSG